MPQNITSGFYAEGKASASSPIPYDVVYISGKEEPGKYLTTGAPDFFIVGEKFTHRLLISKGEFRDFHPIDKVKLEALLQRDDIPEGFKEWLETRQESL